MLKSTQPQAKKRMDLLQVHQSSPPFIGFPREPWCSSAGHEILIVSREDPGFFLVESWWMSTFISPPQKSPHKAPSIISLIYMNIDVSWCFRVIHRRSPSYPPDWTVASSSHPRRRFSAPELKASCRKNLTSREVRTNFRDGIDHLAVFFNVWYLRKKKTNKH